MKSLLISFLALGSLASLSASSFSYQVTVDTSSIGGLTPGFLEFQFNQADSLYSLAATATVSDFTSTGFTFDDTQDSTLGGATGSLSSPPLVLDNTVGATNLFDEYVSKFGSSFSFVVTLAGPALTNTAADGSGFYTFLWSTDYSTNLIGSATTGAVAEVDINGDKTTATTPLAGISTITSYTAPMTATPEPSALSLLGLGAAILLFRRTRSTLWGRQSCH